MTSAPVDLDPETQIEWERWVGRSVWVSKKSRIIGRVVEVYRRPESEITLSPKRRKEIEMQGDFWIAVVSWIGLKGEMCTDRRSLSILRSVRPDLDTRVKMS